MIIDGKKISDNLLSTLKLEVEKIKGRPPSLKVILIGNHPASALYVKRKKEAAEKVGIEAEILRFNEQISESSLIQTIDTLNKNPTVDGIIVQLPLPLQINEEKILEAVSADKDVDGFNPINQGKLLSGSSDCFVSATPLGIQTLLLESGINPAGKHIVIIGRSAIVGRPLFALLSKKGKGGDATVTLAHSQTKNLKQLTSQADIVIAAAGSVSLITKEHIKSGAIVIDVGINRDAGKLVGDVDFDDVKNIASLITPVPGGVGPMTIYALLSNTLKARKMHD